MKDRVCFTIPSILLAAFVSSITPSIVDEAVAQDISVYTLANSTENEMRALTWPRLIRIYYKYDEFRVNKTKRVGDPIKVDQEVYGTGFLISPYGVVITARHVVDILLRTEHGDPRFEIKEKKITGFKREGDSFVPIQLQVVAEDPETSGPDITWFKVSSNGKIPQFHYFCYTDQAGLPTGELRAILLSKPSDADKHVWSMQKIKFRPKLHISEGAYADAWLTTGEFEPSMSGSPVLSNGRVVGVVVARWESQSQPIPRAGFIYPLSYVGKVGKTKGLESKCRRTSDRDPVGPLTQKEFMAGPEGTVSWQPGFGDQNNWQDVRAKHWALPANTDQIYSYVIDRKRLTDPRKRLKPSGGKCEGRILRLVFNHHYSSKTNICSNRVGPLARTYYAVQILPKFFNDGRPVRERVYVYRSGSWFRRDGSHSFRRASFASDECNEPEHSCLNVAMSPRSFFKLHDITNSGVDLSVVDKLLGNSEWHGLPRKENLAASTFKDDSLHRGFWSLLSDIAKEETRKHLENFLIRYAGTTKLATSAPPSIELCVHDAWQYFDLTWSSPDRCIQPKQIRIYLDEYK